MANDSLCPVSAIEIVCFENCEKLKKDKDIIFMALKNNENSIFFVKKSLQKIIKKILRKK